MPLPSVRPRAHPPAPHTHTTTPLAHFSLRFYVFPGLKKLRAGKQLGKLDGRWAGHHLAGVFEANRDDASLLHLEEAGNLGFHNIARLLGLHAHTSLRIAGLERGEEERFASFLDLEVLDVAVTLRPAARRLHEEPLAAVRKHHTLPAR
eukprot:SAG11_NODE_2510_length_3270_cov_4.113844_2_plen_149_part_00